MLKIKRSTKSPILSGVNPRTREQVVREALQKTGEEDGSTVGFAAMADGGDHDSIFVAVIEEQPVVPTAEAEAGTRRFELLHVAGAVSQVAIHTVENLHRGFAVDGAEIGTTLR